MLNDSHKGMTLELHSILTQFPDIDKMLSGLVSSSKLPSVRSAKRGIDTLIYVKQTVKTAKVLHKALISFHHSCIIDHDNTPALELISTVSNIVGNSQLDIIKTYIDDLLAESTTFSKSQHEMRYQECFAVRGGISGELDVARKAYLQSVEDIYEVTSVIIIICVNSFSSFLIDVCVDL